MGDPLASDTVAGIAAAVRPDCDDILREMDERAEREGFPTVGPEVGGWLSLPARAVDAGDARALLGGEMPAATETSAGIAEYLEHIGDADGFETALLPLGEGVVTSVRR